MTKQRNETTLIQDRESSPAGQQGMAAARLALRARAAIHSALRASGVSQKELASRMSLGESRVSQIINGDGNMRLSTLAKVLRALGYGVQLRIHPLDEAVPPLPEPGTRLRRKKEAPKRADRVTVTRSNKNGIIVGSLDFFVPDEEFEDSTYYLMAAGEATAILKSSGHKSQEVNMELDYVQAHADAPGVWSRV